MMIQKTKVDRYCDCKGGPRRMALYPETSAVGMAVMGESVWIGNESGGQRFPLRCVRCGETGTILVSKAFLEVSE